MQAVAARLIRNQLHNIMMSRGPHVESIDQLCDYCPGRAPSEREMRKRSKLSIALVPVAAIVLSLVANLARERWLGGRLGCLG